MPCAPAREGSRIFNTRDGRVHTGVVDAIPHVCDSDSARVPASPACSSPSHADRSTCQRNTTQSSTVLARPACPHVCDSDSARATTPSFSLCGAPPLFLLLAHNLLVPRVH